MPGRRPGSWPRQGYGHVTSVENDRDACTTLRLNRPAWNTLQLDVTKWDASEHEGVHLFAGGVPCPPFAKAGERLGKADERDLFPASLDRIAECKPQAVLLRNVRGLLDSVFDGYRDELAGRLRELGLLVHDWRLLHASDFGVPQLRPRSVMVALREDAFAHFRWPETKLVPPTVGEALGHEMGRLGWEGAEAWGPVRASQIAPTLVGGSKRARRRAWARPNARKESMVGAGSRCPPCRQGATQSWLRG